MSCENCKSKDTCQSKETGCKEENLKLMPRYGNIKNIIGNKFIIPFNNENEFPTDEMNHCIK